MALVLALAGTAHGASNPFWKEAQQKRVHAERSQLSKVARRALPAVVSITTFQNAEGTEPVQQSMADPQKGLGSGFVIHSSGYILTSSHVVEGTTEVRVTLDPSLGATGEYPADVVGMDVETDLALLKIDAGRPLPVLSLGSAKGIDVADWVVVIGNPFGLAHSVSVGVVSHKGRTDVVPEGRPGFHDFLQVDASINPGNSGGPVLDLEGNVVAIANAVNVSGQGIGFAVPIDMAKAVLPQLRKYGSVRRSWLGISVKDAAANQLADRGVVISEVEEGSPAQAAGLEVGDIITRVDTADVESAGRLRFQVATRGVGHWVKLDVRRQNRPMTLRVRLESSPDLAEATPASSPAVTGTAPAAKRGLGRPASP
jgi:serine protease Do